MEKSEFILREHRTASLESTTCEASTQQTHLTILAAVLRHLILLQNADLELQLMYCIPPAFPRTRLQGTENRLHRVWPFFSSVIWRLTSMSGYQPPISQETRMKHAIEN